VCEPLYAGAEARAGRPDQIHEVGDSRASSLHTCDLIAKFVFKKPPQEDWSKLIMLSFGCRALYLAPLCASRSQKLVHAIVLLRHCF
jgi:hypothetical protein